MRYIDLKLVEKSKANKAKKKAAVKKYKTSDEEILDRYKDNTDNIFVSYTVIDKVGINPRSGYNTPIGIYCYPMKYVIDRLKSGQSVPYMGRAPYIQIFSAARPERALNLETYSDSDLQSDTEKLRKYFVGKGMTDDTEFDNIIADSKYGAFSKQNKPASYIWNITRTLSIKVGTGKLKESSQLLDSELLLEWDDSKPSRSVVIWNGIYRNILGYDYAVDPAGYGIIHSAEPTQAVFFSTKGLRVTDRVKNNSDIDYQLQLISRIGQDNPGDAKAQARKTFEYERLISRNLDNSSQMNYLKSYFDRVQSPGLQRKIIKKYPSYIVKFDNLADPKLAQTAKTQFLKIIKKGDDNEIEQLLNTFSYSYGYTKKFFDMIGVGNEWPEFEKAVIEYLDKKNSTYNRLHSFANSYLFDVKRKPWPEFEKYIDSYDHDKYTYVTGAKIDTSKKLKPGDAVKILTGEHKGKKGEVEFSYTTSKYDVVDTYTGKKFGKYHISDLEPIEAKFEPLDDVEMGSLDGDEDDLLAALIIPQVGDTVKITSNNTKYSKYQNMPGKVTGSKLKNGTTVLTVGFSNGDVIEIDNQYTQKVKVTPKASNTTELNFKVGDDANASSPKGKKGYTVVQIDNDGVILKSKTDGKLIKRTFSQFYKANPKYAPDAASTANEPEKLNNINQDALQKLIDKGKETGYVTYSELNSVLPPDEVSSEQIESVFSMISEIGINIVENEPEPPKAEKPKPEVKKTKGPTGKKIMQFVAKAQSAGGDITQAELDSFLPPGTIKDDNLKHILELLKDEGITVDGNPIAIPGDEPVEMPAKKSFEYDGTQKLTTKEKNAWEQIMIKSENDAVVKPLLNKAFKNYSLSSGEFYTLAKNIDFPFWVAGKYLGMAGVKVDASKIKAEYVEQNKGANPPQDY